MWCDAKSSYLKPIGDVGIETANLTDAIVEDTDSLARLKCGLQLHVLALAHLLGVNDSAACCCRCRPLCLGAALGEHTTIVGYSCLSIATDMRASKDQHKADTNNLTEGACCLGSCKRQARTLPNDG